MSDYVAYVGFDVHKDTICVVVATSDRTDSERCRTFANVRASSSDWKSSPFCV